MKEIHDISRELKEKGQLEEAVFYGKRRARYDEPKIYSNGFKAGKEAALRNIEVDDEVKDYLGNAHPEWARGFLSGHADVTT